MKTSMAKNHLLHALHLNTVLLSAMFCESGSHDCSDLTTSDDGVLRAALEQLLHHN